LPFRHAGQPILAERGRWADARVVRGTTVTQGVDVRAIQFDPGADLIGAADGPVTWDEDIDVVSHALEQLEPSEVVLERIRGLLVWERNQGVREHVARDENAALLDQQGRMALGVRRVFDDPDVRAIPGYRRRFGGQTGQEAEQLKRDVIGDLRRERVGDAGLSVRVRQQISHRGRAAGGPVAGRFTERGARARDPNPDAWRSPPQPRGPTP
jgi:hypothetical protein